MHVEEVMLREQQEVMPDVMALSLAACICPLASDVQQVMLINDQMINRSSLSHTEKLLVAHVERLLWSRRGSNPVHFGL
jgi:hypothetical protein